MVQKKMQGYELEKEKLLSEAERVNDPGVMSYAVGAKWGVLARRCRHLQTDYAGARLLVPPPSILAILDQVLCPAQARALLHLA